jgi:hypothetical protein
VARSVASQIDGRFHLGYHCFTCGRLAPGCISLEMVMACLPALRRGMGQPAQNATKQA